MQVRGRGNLGGDFHLLVDHAERHGRHADADGFAYPYGFVGEPLAELLRESEAGLVGIGPPQLTVLADGGVNGRETGSLVACRADEEEDDCAVCRTTPPSDGWSHRPGRR